MTIRWSDDWPSTARGAWPTAIVTGDGPFATPVYDRANDGALTVVLWPTIETASLHTDAVGVYDLKAWVMGEGDHFMPPRITPEHPDPFRLVTP